MAEWVYDFVVAYRLTSGAVQAFLVELFGNYNFSVELVNDHFRFVSPRPLSTVGPDVEMVFMKLTEGEAERNALLQRKEYNNNE
ncbi:hypothetical protein FKW77_009929 [Venturia effusa]|uniref:Uncharacterized protein n=1 Tax=Venturia effusa TaxID=50376 RepID=A0A517L688_9PEZI|nr:hypothetical protein FKW77_009929 [Venturia effusa]